MFSNVNIYSKPKPCLLRVTKVNENLYIIKFCDYVINLPPQCPAEHGSATIDNETIETVNGKPYAEALLWGKYKYKYLSENYFIVSFTSAINQRVRLGFKPELVLSKKQMKIKEFKILHYDDGTENIIKI